MGWGVDGFDGEEVRWAAQSWCLWLQVLISNKMHGMRSLFPHIQLGAALRQAGDTANAHTPLKSNLHTHRQAHIHVHTQIYTACTFLVTELNTHPVKRRSSFIPPGKLRSFRVQPH